MSERLRPLRSRDKPILFRIGITYAEWGPFQAFDRNGEVAKPVEVPANYQKIYDEIKPDHIEPYGEQSRVCWLDRPRMDDAARKMKSVAVDVDGKRHEIYGRSIWEKGNDRLSVDVFKLPAERIDHFEYRFRPYQHWVTFENVSLQAGKASNVKIATKSLPSKPPAKPATDAKTESAAQILQKVVDKHRFWLDPRPKTLSYVLTGGNPEPDDNDKMVHHVWVSGENVRWEMDALLPIRSLEYTTIITPERTVWLRPPEAKNKAMTNVSDTHRFRQGMTWQTAFHAIANNGVPAKCQVVDEIESKEGRVVVVEAEFENGSAMVGLGMYQLQFGKSNWAFLIKVLTARSIARLPAAARGVC